MGQLKEKIEKYFSQYSDLRVLFFFDAEKSHEQEVAQLDVPDVKILTLHHNEFYLKTRLHGEWATDKVFLYVPQEEPAELKSYKKFPLLGLLLANKTLKLDDIGEFMETYRLSRQHKNLVRKYIKVLHPSEVQAVCRPILSPSKLNEGVLQQGLVSALLDFSKIEPWSILIGKLLTFALPEQEKKLTRFEGKVANTDLSEIIKHQVKHYLDVQISDIEATTLLQLLRRILYNKITQTIPNAPPTDPYRALKITRPDVLVDFNRLLQEVEQHPSVQKSFLKAIASVDKDIQGEKLIEAYSIEATFASYTPDMLWETMHQLGKNLSLHPLQAIEQLEKRSLQQNLATAIQDSLQFLVQAGKTFAGINDIAHYTLNYPDAYILQYTQEWMLIDQAYRKAIFVYRKSDLAEIPEKVNLEGILEQLNAAYEKHLEALNRAWLACLAEFKFTYERLSTPKQYNFYKNEVADYDQKVVVIISDALRYEAGEQLLAEMHGDPKNTAAIRHQLASIPSKTNIGMAHLLPGKEKIYNKGKVKIDGYDISDTKARKILLKTFTEDAIAIQYNVIKEQNQKENRVVFKNKLVYVYHDVIDALGDKRVSERKSFKAVEDTIDELKKFVKLLHSTYNVSRVLVTADHGFLYNDRTIEEKDKESSTGFKHLQTHNRFELLTVDKRPELGYQFPFSATTQFKEALHVVIPESVNRYKKAGVGHQFVHGGGSLQELVVPIIESSRKRIEVAKKVKPMLLTDNLRIVSNILRVDLLQQNKVSRFEKEVTISVGLYKDLELVSNEAIIVLYETAENPSERMHRIELTLSDNGSNESFLKLKVFDVADKLNSLMEERVQNNTLIQPDF